MVSESHESLSRNNWALGVITGIPREQFQRLTLRDQQVLKSGRYRNPLTGEVVTFTLPWDTETEYNSPPTSSLVNPPTARHNES